MQEKVIKSMIKSSLEDDFLGYLVSHKTEGWVKLKKHIIISGKLGNTKKISRYLRHMKQVMKK